MLRLTIALVPLAFVALSGCADGGFSGTVEVGDNYFKPKSATIDAGDEMHFEVESGAKNPHTITIHLSTDPATTLKLDQDVQAGEDTHYTFAAAGTYHVWCTFHGTMTSGMSMLVTVE